MGGDVAVREGFTFAAKVEKVENDGVEEVEAEGGDEEDDAEGRADN